MKDRFKSSEFQSGQAMAEFLVVSVFALVPVMLGTVFLMKLGNSQHEMHEAARYAAWERTVWSANGKGAHHKSDASVLNEAVARILGEPEAPVDTLVDGKAVKAKDRKFDPMIGINKGDGNRGPVFKEEKDGFHSLVFNDNKPTTGGGRLQLNDNKGMYGVV